MAGTSTTASKHIVDVPVGNVSRRQRLPKLSRYVCDIDGVRLSHWARTTEPTTSRWGSTWTTACIGWIAVCTNSQPTRTRTSRMLGGRCGGVKAGA